MNLEKKIPGLLTLTGTQMPPRQKKNAAQEERLIHFSKYLPHAVNAESPVVQDIPMNIQDSRGAENMGELFEESYFGNDAEKYGAPGFTIEPSITSENESNLNQFLDMSNYNGKIVLHSAHAFSHPSLTPHIYKPSSRGKIIEKRGDVQDRHVLPISENTGIVALEDEISIVTNSVDMYGKSKDVTGIPLSQIAEYSDGKVPEHGLEKGVLPHTLTPDHLKFIQLGETPETVGNLKGEEETQVYKSFVENIEGVKREDNFISSLNVIDDRIYAGTSQGQIIDVLDQKIIGQRKGPEDVAYGSAVNDIVKVGSNIVDVGRYGVFDTKSGQAIDPHAKVIAGTTDTEGSSLYTILEDNIAGKEARVAYDHGRDSTIMTMDPRGLPRTFGKTLEYTDDISQFVPKTSYRRE